MFFYSRIKNYMIERHPNAVLKYASYVNSFDKISRKDRLVGYLYFTKLLFFDDKYKTIKKGEFEDNQRKSIDKFNSIISKYDAISFDVFDTLILRNVETPDDVFKVVGDRCRITGFQKIRKEAEKICKREVGDYYTLDDIYSVLETYNGIKPFVKDVEISAEIELSVSNPYMKTIYDSALSMGKNIIITSDMYLSSKILDRILLKNGYDRYDELFVSCECNSSKKQGDLYRYIKKKLDITSSIVHIGDNFFSDFLNPKKYGVHSIFYKSVTNSGIGYRYSNIIDQSLGTSVSNALINNKIHNGLCLLNTYQQYGYVYGGPLVTGFCHWINKHISDANVEKVLFLSRDSEVIFKVYSDYYKKTDAEYVYASRRAILPLLFEFYPKFFLERVVKEWATQNEMTVQEVLEESHMTCIKNMLKEENIELDDVFSLTNYEHIMKLMIKYKDDIVDELRIVRDAAADYWKSVIGDAKTIGLVDVGWRGSIPTGLNIFLNKICDFEVDIYCFQLSTERNEWNYYEYDENKLLSYCCSSDFNTDMYKLLKHDLVRLKIIELIFASSENSLISYEYDDNGCVTLKFEKHKSQSEEMIKDMHLGVFEFANDFKRIESDNSLDLSISGEVAFKPMHNIKKSKNYIYRLFKNYILYYDNNKHKYIYVKDYFKENGY